MRVNRLLAVVFGLMISGTMQAQGGDSLLFDFWVGEWDLTWTDAQGNRKTGENSVYWKWNRSVLVEEFQAHDGSLTGGSESVFHAKTRTWKQTWTDNTRDYITLSGTRDGENRIFETEPMKKGKTVTLSRMVFSEITADGFVWDWQKSVNKGKTWASVWKIAYSRRKPVDVETIAVLKLAPEEIPGKGNLKALDFLNGAWKGPGLGGLCDEVWLPAMDSSKAGVFRYSRDGRIVFSEFMVFEQVGETLQLRLKHFNRDLSPWEQLEQWTTFRFIKAEGQTAYFHGLTYHRSGNELIIRLALKQKGEMRTETFSFKKAAL